MAAAAQLGMRMSAEDATPVTESREQPITFVGVASPPPSGEAEAVVAGGFSEAAVIVKGSDAAATTKQAAGAVTTPSIPEKPLQGNDLLEAIKKQVCNEREIASTNVCAFVSAQFGCAVVFVL